MKSHGAVERRIADFAFSYECNDSAVRHAAKRLLLDTLGVAWAGVSAPGVEPLARLARNQGGRAEARIWGFGSSVPAAQAAFVNGTACAALDFDAVHAASILHADAVIAPVVVALGEQTGSSGRAVLDAYIVGVEIAHRLSLATGRRGPWFGSSTAGVFGAAAAAARLLGLSAEGVHMAMGIALSLSAGTKQAIVERTLTKRLQTAFAARSGIHAAEAAQAGMSGPLQWLEGEYGWFHNFEAGDAARVVDGLGANFDFMATGIKKFPSCLCNHAVIDAASSLMRDEGLKPSDVQSAEVIISPYMHRIVGATFDPSGDAQVAAQFSVQYAAACAIDHGSVELTDVDADHVRQGQAARLARSIKVSVDDSWPGQVGPGAVRIQAKDGRTIERRVDQLPGSVERPLSDEEVRGKAVSCLTSGRAAVSRVSAERFAAQVMNIERLAHVSELFAELEKPCSQVA